MLITADKVFDGQQFLTGVTVEISDGTIVQIHSEVLPEAIHYSGTLTAGFIDVHVNGGGGKLLNFEPELDTLSCMVNAHAKFGSTALVPTLITDEYRVMAKAADAVAEAIAQDVPGVLGIHFEGPHLSVPKKGIHEGSLVRPLGEAEKALFCREDLGKKIVTLAPENVTDQDIQTLLESEVKVSIGHSNASFERAQQVVDLGVDGFTHLFNAMSPFTSREPGVVGAALANDSAWCGIILDGHHMHYSSAKVAHSAKAQGKLLLVTDAMSTIGSEQDGFEFFGVSIKRDGDKLASPEGTLAGSALDMITAVKNAVVELNVELSEALNMASLFPAEYLRLADQMGSIAVGKQADLTVFSDDFKVTNTWIRGELVFSS